MKLIRISAVIQRHLFITLRDASVISELFYWPLYDIILWGFATTWFGAGDPKDQKIVLATLACLVLWQVVYRTCQDVCRGMVEEIWSRNLVNLFSTPISIVEWLLGVMALGLLKVVPSLIFAATAVWYLYNINILSLGLVLVPYILSLIVSGWCIGILISCFLISWGHRAQTLVWTLAYAFAPMSGVFFSISVFPKSIQIIAKLLPTTYIFASARELIFNNIINWHYFYIATVLNIFYFIITLLLFKFSFERSRALGLARLEVD